MQSIYIGLFFKAIGILVRFFPGLIAGYNQLSSREKDNALTNGLHKFMSTVFSIMGALAILAHFVAEWTDMPSLKNIAILVTLIGVVVMVVFSQIFTKER
ncbi:DUF3784 domain-containing protein [Litoribacter alkaliphilus]|uniref:DUF3784 domain-containing protein n=1 Tax=Litoribacter ruber TaxID=702568 RepID=A0AAP2CIW5_9BACT|nr:DUF3784 domain-containing protein [Litoribacter alkaliphilus]MBS9525017.1 DUF3784 domain-containing protein [Litoribacter alkaliphilus]